MGQGQIFTCDVHTSLGIVSFSMGKCMLDGKESCKYIFLRASPGL